MKSPESDQFWVTIVDAGADGSTYGEYVYVADKAMTAQLVAPKKSGSYEVRLHANYPKKETNLVQRIPITVERPESAGSVELQFTGIRSRYSNAKNAWAIEFGEEPGTLTSRYSNSITSWNVEMPSGAAEIQSKYSNSFTNWTYAGGSGEIAITAVYSNSVAPWRVTSASGEVLTVATVYSNSLAKWEISGIGDGMSVNATDSKGLGAWRIEDRIPGVDPDLKMAAVFACIIATLIH